MHPLIVTVKILFFNIECWNLDLLVSLNSQCEPWSYCQTHHKLDHTHSSYNVASLGILCL